MSDVVETNESTARPFSQVEACLERTLKSGPVDYWEAKEMGVWGWHRHTSRPRIGWVSTLASYMVYRVGIGERVEHEVDKFCHQLKKVVEDAVPGIQVTVGATFKSSGPLDQHVELHGKFLSVQFPKAKPS